MGKHNDVAHRRMPAQDRLNLARLDAIPSNLYLLVRAADIFDISVGAITPPVARSIQTLPGNMAVTMGGKFLRSQSRFMEITPGQSHSADANLAGDAYRNRVQMPVEDIHIRIGDGAADGNQRLFVTASTSPGSCTDRDLGGAIEICQLSGGTGKELPLKIAGQDIAAAGNLPQCCK